MKRKDQREWLVKMTYEALICRRTNQNVDQLLESHDLPVSNSYLNDSMRSIFLHWDMLEDLIERNLTHWKLSRLPLIDRAILMVASNEMALTKFAPASVTINECVEIAKIYSNAESYKFINGVLAGILQDLTAEKEDINLQARESGNEAH